MVAARAELDAAAAGSGVVSFYRLDGAGNWTLCQVRSRCSSTSAAATRTSAGAGRQGEERCRRSNVDIHVESPRDASQNGCSEVPTQRVPVRLIAGGPRILRHATERTKVEFVTQGKRTAVAGEPRVQRRRRHGARVGRGRARTHHGRIQNASHDAH